MTRDMFRYPALFGSSLAVHLTLNFLTPMSLIPITIISTLLGVLVMLYLDFEFALRDKRQKHHGEKRR